MSIHRRLTLLILLVIIGAVVYTFGIGWFQVQTIARIHKERNHAQFYATAQMVALHSEPLIAYVTDYTIWDDMARFSQTCNADWATTNLAATRAIFHADAVWVFRSDGHLCYASNPTIELSPVTLGLGAQPPTVGRLIHTFLATDTLVWDVAAATIHPTSDPNRTTRPQGWFIVARRLDPPALSEIGSLLNSQVSLRLGEVVDLAAADQMSDTLQTLYPLLDHRGVPVATLIVIKPHPLIREIKHTTSEVLVLTALANLLIFVLLSLGLSRWVAAPLRVLTYSVQHEQPAVLNGLIRERGEFGKLAGLVQDFFAQHTLLTQEVDARQQAEATLRSFFDNTGLMMGIVELLADDILHIADNATTAAFFGTTVAAMRGQRASLLGAPPEAIQRWLRAYRESDRLQQPVQFEYAHTTASTCVWLSATVCCIGPSASGQMHYSYVVIDITERQAIESQLRASQQQLKALNTRLREVAQTDGLTGLRNRATFDERLNEELAHTVDSGTPMSLLLIDIDHFKRYNDTYGHVAGDEVLRMIARIFQEHARQSDTAARYGGEEFAIILSNTREQGAMLAAERIRQHVEQMSWPEQDITISIGVATCHQPVIAQHLVALADCALYRAKKQGRNQVVHAGQCTPAPGNPDADRPDAESLQCCLQSILPGYGAEIDHE